MDNSYTLIPDFLLDYDLTLSETVALAVIYGFSQDGKSSFKGSYNYLARKCKLQRRQTIYVLEKLVDKGLVVKDVHEKNGVLSCSFRANLGSAEIAHPVQKMHGGSAKNAPGGSAEIAPNNISIENIKDNKDISTSFNFLKALMDLGVTEEVARAWMQVRKHQRATNTKIAFDKIKSEIVKSGRPADDCIRTAVEKSWRGFQADWLPAKKEYRGTRNGQSVSDYLKEKGLI